MEHKDIRWIQRFMNYQKALKQLGNAVELAEDRPLSDLERQGLIQAFEYTFELGWKTLQDLIKDWGYEGKLGEPNLVIKEAAFHGLIEEKEWKTLNRARNTTSHTYNEEDAQEIEENIINSYYDIFIKLETRLQAEKLKQTGK